MRGVTMNKHFFLVIFVFLFIIVIIISYKNNKETFVVNNTFKVLLQYNDKCIELVDETIIKELEKLLTGEVYEDYPACGFSKKYSITLKTIMQ